MNHLALLTSLLFQVFGWHLARAKCGAAIIVALIKVRTVNLTDLATALPGKAKVDSKYKRLQRFFKEVSLDFRLVAKLIVSWLPEGPWILAMDRTNWMIGQWSINILYLAIVYNGVAIPILWNCLPKKGNSNTTERIALMNHFLAIFGIDKIDYLVVDREFVGGEWISYLIESEQTTA